MARSDHDPVVLDPDSSGPANLVKQQAASDVDPEPCTYDLRQAAEEIPTRNHSVRSATVGSFVLPLLAVRVMFGHRLAW